MDAPLQVADGPGAHASNLSQLLLSEARIRPQPPQQLREAQCTLLGHRCDVPSGAEVTPAGICARWRAHPVTNRLSRHQPWRISPNQALSTSCLHAVWLEALAVSRRALLHVTNVWICDRTCVRDVSGDVW